MSDVLRLAAFAIEDRVDFRYVEHRYDAPSAKIEKAIEEFSGELTPMTHDQSDYFEQVYKLMDKALEKLKESRPKGSRGSSGTAFDRLDSIVISTPGVVWKNKELVQLPLWRWTTEKRVSWMSKKGRVSGFNFPRVVCEIVQRHSPETDIAALADKVFVINDATSCAAVEYNNRTREDAAKAHEFVYLKAHNGVNVGVIEERMAFTKNDHTEMGHFYPNYHAVDADNKFMGTCPFHGNCLEGMISLRSLFERARPANAKSRPIPEWSRILDRLEGPTGLQQPGSSALFKEVIGSANLKKARRGTKLGVEVAAHYLAQIVHIIMLSPMLPDQIIIGGRFATDAVVGAIRDNVWNMAREYPLRPTLETKDGLEMFIQKSQAHDPRGIEVIGALEIARGRALKVLETARKASKPRSGNVSDIFSRRTPL